MKLRDNPEREATEAVGTPSESEVMHMELMTLIIVLLIVIAVAEATEIIKR